MIVTSSIQITPELLALVAEVDEFKGAWRALGTLARLLGPDIWRDRAFRTF
jgi:hypothetical protein